MSKSQPPLRFVSLIAEQKRARHLNNTDLSPPRKHRMNRARRLSRSEPVDRGEHSLLMEREPLHSVPRSPACVDPWKNVLTFVKLWNKLFQLNHRFTAQKFSVGGTDLSVTALDLHAKTTENYPPICGFKKATSSSLVGDLSLRSISLPRSRAQPSKWIRLRGAGRTYSIFGESCQEFSVPWFSTSLNGSHDGSYLLGAHHTGIFMSVFKASGLLSLLVHRIRYPVIRNRG